MTRTYTQPYADPKTVTGSSAKRSPDYIVAEQRRDAQGRLQGVTHHRFGSLAQAAAFLTINA